MHVQASETDLWGPWIDHRGGGIPVPLGTVIHRKFDGNFDMMMGQHVARRDEHIGPVRAAEALSWTGIHTELPHGYVPQVIRYRVRQFRAMRELKALCANPQPEGAFP